MTEFLATFLDTIRQIIIDSAEIKDDMIEFNTAKAIANGHQDTDVALADEILSHDCYFTDKFADTINFLFKDSDFNCCGKEFKPLVYYIPAVRIIFVINVHDGLCTYIFEEELIREVAIRETLNKYLDYDKPYPEYHSKGVLIQHKWRE